jgi:hypothetical protein
VASADRTEINLTFTLPPTRAFATDWPSGIRREITLTFIPGTRRRRHDGAVFLAAFDLLELSTASICGRYRSRRAAPPSRACSARSSTGCTSPIMSRPRARPCSDTPVCSGSKASSQSGRAPRIAPAGRSTGIPASPAVKREAEEDWGR